MTIRMLHPQTHEVIIDLFSSELTWQDWHQLANYLTKIVTETQSPLTLTLLFELDTHISEITSETLEYFLNPKIFKTIRLSARSTEYDDFIHGAVDLINTGSV